MTNWLAAGLVLPRATIISLQPEEEMNKGDEERRMETGVEGQP